MTQSKPNHAVQGLSKKTIKPIVLALNLALLTLAGCSKKPETLVTGGYDEKAMEAAISRARAETEDFIAVLRKNDADSFSVKAPITDNGETEHFWLTDISYADGVFSGKIGNDPGLVGNVQFGQAWKIKKGEISDWMFTRGDKIYGGYTIDPLLETLPKEEAESMRKTLVR